MQMSAPADLSLKTKLARANRRRQLAAAALVAPAFVFLAVAFLVPLGSILFYAVENTDVAEYMPRSSAAIADWDGAGTPGEPVFEALFLDLKEGYEAKTIARAATSLNHQIAGFRSLVMGTARRTSRIEGPPYRDAILEVRPRWAEVEVWIAFQRAAVPITPRYVLAAVDLERSADGAIGWVPEERQVYIDYLERTVWISLVVTVLCFLIAFPMAYLMAMGSEKLRRVLFILVLLPFWTSLLVRTAAWVILLQKNGVVNDALIWIGLTDAPLQLVFNRFGVFHRCGWVGGGLGCQREPLAWHYRNRIIGLGIGRCEWNNRGCLDFFCNGLCNWRRGCCRFGNEGFLSFLFFQSFHFSNFCHLCHFCRVFLTQDIGGGNDRGCRTGLGS